MTQQYLIGQLSVLLGQLEARCGDRTAVHDLRRRVEQAPLQQAPELTHVAIELADASCWAALERGDVAEFVAAAKAAAALGEFADCAWPDHP